MERSDKTEEARGQSARDFAAWLRDQLTIRGYNLALRGGGQRRFAADAGITTSTVSRMLAGEGSTDTRTLEKVAASLGVSLGEVMIRAGVLTPHDLQAVTYRDPNRPPLTPDQAADELGITDPYARRVFNATIKALRTEPTEQRRAE
ncbi:helix-turn-helix domain-containing protein [Streptomyces chryseus]